LSSQAETGGRGIPNVLPFYTAEGAYEHISAYTPEAVRIYHRIVLLDVLLLIPLYVLFLTSALLQAGGRRTGPVIRRSRACPRTSAASAGSSDPRW
jgi:hypothetical protein